MWDIVELETNLHSHNMTDSLKVVITQVMSNINTDYVIYTGQQFQSRFEAIIAAECDYINKHVLQPLLHLCIMFYVNKFSCL